MKVLALASYPIEAAATRYRLQQFVVPLASRDIQLSIHPFLNSKLFGNLYRREVLAQTAAGLLKSALLRVQDVMAVRRFDVLMVQREAMLFGPPIVEWLSARALRSPMLLDLDDATYVSYTSPTYGRIGRAFKWFSKTDDLIRWAKIVTCGNRTIAEYVTHKGGSSRIIPTVVDTEVFRPSPDRNAGGPVIGWVGTHSTFSYLESIFPVLQELAKSHTFRLKIVGAGRREVILPGVDVENVQWELSREVSDFQSFDIGLYPIDSSLYADKWAAGKSGFKAIQYMAVGIPYVTTPVGAAAEIGEVGTTHFTATTQDEWLNALNSLLANPQLRQKMGAAGRACALRDYNLEDQAEKLATALFEVAKS